MSMSRGDLRVLMALNDLGEVYMPDLRNYLNKSLAEKWLFRKWPFLVDVFGMSFDNLYAAIGRLEHKEMIDWRLLRHYGHGGRPRSLAFVALLSKKGAEYALRHIA